MSENKQPHAEALARIIQMQLELMQQQLKALGFPSQTMPEALPAAVQANPIPPQASPVSVPTHIVPAPQTRHRSSPIAVVGMSGRFPGARNVGEFWQNLMEGRDSISHWTPEEIDPSVPASERLAPNYGRSRGILEDADAFDAEFFRISPREAKLIDPQQRIFLEIAYEALQDAGYDPDAFPGEIGVFGGVGDNFYHIHNVLDKKDLIEKVGALSTTVGNMKDYAATRISYKLNLKGPSVSLNTACSTSLVAVDQAVWALRNKTCDMALAGAASLYIPQKAGFLYGPGLPFSSDGQVRPFSADATGVLFSDGAGMVLLKRLEDAERDGDHIYGLIIGTAINNDGLDKMSFFAPSAEGQTRVIRKAMQDAGIGPETLSFVEAHATGTLVGDPVEFQGLLDAFAGAPTGKPFCALGAYKGNIGHTDAAAGVTGLIKALLSLKNGVLPKNLHFSSPNPALPLAGSPFYIPREHTRLVRGQGPLRAGVSAFGFGGTNSHVIVEEAPRRAATPVSSAPQLLTFSAESSASLMRTLADFAQAFETRPEIALADAAHTLAHGRKSFRYRHSLTATSVMEAATKLRETTAVRESSPQSLAYIFPGQGVQSLRMGAELYAREPVYRASLDASAKILEAHLGLDIRTLVFAEGPEAEARLEQTAMAQPAIFAVQLALMDLVEAQGLRPSALIGHSLGELACAVRAGVMSREDALYLVVHRGRLMQSMAPGGMMSVNLTETEARAQMSSSMSLAAVNGPRQSVLAGPRAELEELRVRLEAQGVQAKMLRTSHAFHSQTVDAIRTEFLELFARVRLSPPQIPIVSSLTGRWAEAKEIMQPTYWADHMRGTVRFFEAVQTLWAEAPYLLLELGPRDNASVLARKASPDPLRYRAISTLRIGAEIEGLLNAWGELWSAGQTLNLKKVITAGQTIPLPTYSFEKVSHWLEAKIADEDQAPRAMPAPRIEEKAPIALVSSIATSEVLPELIDWLEEASGIRLRPEHASSSFLELGFDSLTLTQLSAKLSGILKTPLSYTRIARELNTAARLSAHIRSERIAAEERHDSGLEASGLQKAPASYAQKRIWLHQQLNPTSGTYNIPVAFDLKGPLDKAALKAAAAALIERHSVLRTVFELEGTEVFQKIVASCPLVFEELDLRAKPEELESQLQVDGRRPFSTAEAPVLRFHLYRIEEAHWVLLINASHIAFDLLSIRNMLKELQKDYEGLLSGLEPQINNEVPSYLDFTLWQSKRFQSGELDRLVNFWKPVLEPISRDVLKLPLDKNRPARQPNVNENLVLWFDKSRIAELLEKARSQSINSFALLMAAYAQYLGLRSGQGQVAIGSTIASRSLPETQGMMGFFANTLVFSLAPAAGESFLAYAARYQAHILEAFDHQDAPIEELVRSLSPVRDLRYNTLFQTFFSFEKVNEAPIRMGAAELRFRCDVTRAAPATDINVWAEEHDTQFRFELDYSNELWTSQGLKSFFEGFLIHLENLSQPPKPVAPQAPAGFDLEAACRDLLGLSRIDMNRSLAQQGGHSLLALRLIERIQKETGAELSLKDVLKAKDLNAIQDLMGLHQKPAEVLGLHQTFEKSAAAHPQKTAVKYRKRTLSYEALNERSNQLGHALRRRGVQPGECVGLAMDRSLDMIIAMLGILKAGAAYLPMDPSYPNDRLSYMAENSKLRWVLSEEEYAGTLILPESVQLIEFDTEKEAIEREAKTSLALPITADQLAYVIYTSGSTGKPKGVEIPHASATAFLAGMARAVPFTSDDVLMGLTTISFDISVLEIFLTFAQGATLILMDSEDALDGKKLARTIESEHVSVFQATPSGWRILLDSGWEGSRTLVGLCGGEAFPRDLAERIIPRVREIHNVYGPTEATVWATSQKLETPDDHKLIGRALPGYQIWIVDEQLQPLPVGDIGRLFIGGQALARGYSHRPELTTERFIASPFAPGERIYDTGDLALIRPDGRIEYVSRADDQVKIRGYRIELGEIESVANSFGPVRLSAAVVHEFAPGDQRIVLFVETRSSQPFESAEILEHMRGALPNYFLPNIVRFVPKIPMTQNGKIDRKPLRASLSQVETESKPENGSSLETWLIELWMRHLQSGGLNGRSKFFEQGGYSLLAIIVAKEMSERSGVTIGLNDLLSSTLEQLASKMGQGARA